MGATALIALILISVGFSTFSAFGSACRS